MFTFNTSSSKQEFGNIRVETKDCPRGGKIKNPEHHYNHSLDCDSGMTWTHYEKGNRQEIRTGKVTKLSNIINNEINRKMFP